MCKPMTPGRRRPGARLVGLSVYVLALALQAQGAWAAAAAASPGAPAAPAAAVPPPIPLDISQPYALCSRPRPYKPVSIDGHTECDLVQAPAKKTGSYAADPTELPGIDVGSLWTARENCQLSLAYSQERWKDVQKIVLNFLHSLDCTDLDGQHRDLDFNAYYSALFLNEASGGPTLNRALIHEHPNPEVYGNRVGNYDLYDLQLMPDVGIAVTSIYQAAPLLNPLITQVAGAVAQAAAGAKSVAPASIETMLPAPAKSNLIEFTKGHVAGTEDELKVDAGRQRRPQTEEPAAGPEKAKGAVVRFVIRRVNPPSAFKRGGFATSSFLPQVTVADQLVPSIALENYMLSALRYRAARYDDAFNCFWDCSTLPCTALHPQFYRPCPLNGGSGPLATVNKELATQYLACRQKTPTIQAILRIESTDTNFIYVNASLVDVNGNPFPAAAFDFTVTIGEVTKTYKDACEKWVPAGKSTANFRCTVDKAGLFAIAATVKAQSDFPFSLPPVVPGSPVVHSTEVKAVKWLFRPLPSPTLKGTLVLGDRSASPTGQISATYTLVSEAYAPPSKPVEICIKILDYPEGTTKQECLGQAIADMSKGLASGVIQLDPGVIGPGDHAAVLDINSSGDPAWDKAGDSSWEHVAAVSFTVGSAATVAGGAAPAPAVGCVPSVTAYLPTLVNGLNGSQPFEYDFADLNISYAATLALAAPAATPAAAPAAPSLSTQYTFGKLTRWSFSLGLGAAVGSFLDGRPAQVISSSTMTPVFAPNPPSAALTYVTADLHPWAYDETRYSPSLAERLRLMLGVAITPNAGIVVGGGFSLIRGLSLEAGCAFLVGNLLPSGQQFFVSPLKPGDSTRTGFFGRFFFGLGYAFE